MKNFILSSYVHSNLSVVYINKKLGAILYDFLVGHFLIEQSFRPQIQMNRVPTLDTRITQLVLINWNFLNLKIKKNLKLFGPMALAGSLQGRCDRKSRVHISDFDRTACVSGTCK